MLRDRFGRVPAEAKRLVDLMGLRAPLAAMSITRLAWRGGAYHVEFRDRVALESGFAGRCPQLRPLETGVALLVLPASASTAQGALAWLEDALQRAPDEPKMASP